MNTISISVPKHKSGCYILRLKGEVVYVGLSSNVLSRLGGHRHKEYDSIEIIWCPIIKATKLERKLIAQYRPRLNTSLVPPKICATEFWKNYSGAPKAIRNDCGFGWNAAASGKLLKAYRESCGIPRKVLAALSGVSENCVHQMEKGKSTRLDSWDVICSGFFKAAKLLTTEGQKRSSFAAKDICPVFVAASTPK